MGGHAPEADFGTTSRLVRRKPVAAEATLEVARAEVALAIPALRQDPIRSLSLAHQVR